MKIALIVAMTRERRVIGKRNALPWHIPEDLKRFKEITLGHPIVMGRKTFESIGRPLPKRENIVISRNRDWRHTDVKVFHSFEDVMENYANEDRVFVIGGSEIFKIALPYAEELFITWIQNDIEGDSFFPDFSLSDYQLVNEELPKEESEFQYVFSDYVRKN